MRQYPVYLLLFCKGHLTPCVFKGENGGRGVFFSQNRVFPAAWCGRSFSFFHGGRNLEKGVIVKLEDIVVVFDDEQVLKNINLDINDKEFVTLLGPSGCGKTTLLNTLYDIVDYPLVIDQGRVVLEGEKDGKKYSFESGKIRDTWWNNIAYVPQAAQSVLNPIVRLKTQFLDSIPKDQKKNEKPEETLARVADYLKELNLSPDVLESFPFQLSGGMRQRAIIALATFMSPGVVLADEPTTALDVVVQKGILMMLMRLQKQLKNTMIIVSHDMGVHYQITDRMAIMYSGSIAELGKTEDIFNDPIHPYTKMLVDALPRVGEDVQRVGIAGRPPALKNPPPGCRFAPRCPHATDRCRSEVPKFREIRPGRFAACHLLEEEVKTNG